MGERRRHLETSANDERAGTEKSAGAHYLPVQEI